MTHSVPPAPRFSARLVVSFALAASAACTRRDTREAAIRTKVLRLPLARGLLLALPLFPAVHSAVNAPVLRPHVRPGLGRTGESPMQKVSLGLFAVLACTWGCGPLANDPVAGDGGGGSDATSSIPTPGHDSGSPANSSDAGQGGQGDDAAASEGGSPGDDGGTPDSGSDDTGTVPPVDSAPPPPACSETGAAWVAGAGIASTGWKATATATATNDGTLYPGRHDRQCVRRQASRRRWSDGARRKRGRVLPARPGPIAIDQPGSLLRHDRRLPPRTRSRCRPTT